MFVQRTKLTVGPEVMRDPVQLISFDTRRGRCQSRGGTTGSIVGDQVLLSTGLRRTEALRLRWQNVNLRVGTLCAVDTKNRSDHMLPMGRYLWELMRRRRRASDSDWVFANPLTGNRITDPHRQVVNVVAKSGVPFSPHKRLWNRIERQARYIDPDQLAACWQAAQGLKDRPQYPSREVHRDYLLLASSTRQ